MNGKDALLMLKFWEIGRNGLSINFEYILHKCSPHRYPRPLEEASVINNEIKKTSLERSYHPNNRETGFFSNIFCKTKNKWDITNDYKFKSPKLISKCTSLENGVNS